MAAPRLIPALARAAALAAAAVALLSASRSQPESCPDPFDFLSPTITLSDRDRRRIDAGEPVVRVLEAEGREVAVLGAVAVAFDGDRLAAWIRRIDLLKKSAKVPAVSRFADPATPNDVRELVLDEQDLKDLRTCRPGSCDLKLTADEIAHLRPELAALGKDWKPGAQEAFRRVILERVHTYRSSGHAALGTYADGHSDVALADVAQMLLDRSPYLTDHLPDLVDYLTRYPVTAPPRSESFVYWSTDRFGGRPVTSATHVTITRPEGPRMPDTVVAGKQLFATHYQNGSLSLTLLLRGCTESRNYLVYVSRSDVDVIRGMLGWLTRRIIQGRVESEAVDLLTSLRDRLSSPPEGGRP